jgi:hypothetical protein
MAMTGVCRLEPLESADLGCGFVAISVPWPTGPAAESLPIEPFVLLLSARGLPPCVEGVHPPDARVLPAPVG